jgi:hypothetical protein
MVLTLPAPAMPYTRVPKSSGAMIALISRRKIAPRTAALFAGPGNKAPKAIPPTSPIMIQDVRENRLTPAPSAPSYLPELYAFNGDGL